MGRYTYALTFAVASREPVFVDGDLAAKTIAHLLRTARLESFAILADCLMPDHAHLLAEGQTDTASLRRFGKRAKQATGQSYAFSAQRPLWQRGYFDRVIRQDQDVLAAARYIVFNPVRAGLVATPAEYPHSGSDVWTLDDLLES